MHNIISSATKEDKNSDGLQFIPKYKIRWIANIGDNYSGGGAATDE